MSIKSIALGFTLAMTIGGMAVAAHADPIDISGNITFTSVCRHGQLITFSDLTASDPANPLDSVNGTAITISPTTHFYFDHFRGDTGYFSARSTGTISIGNADTSGLLTGTISSLELHLTSPGSFTLTLNLRGLVFNRADCGTTCSAALASFSVKGNESLTFTFNEAWAGSMCRLYHMHGIHTTGVEGEMDPPGSSPTPEPVSLGLFGTGFVLAGWGMLRRRRGRA